MKPEEVHKIVQEHKITIPAWILYTLVQYVETSVKHGGISAGQLTSVGYAYETGSGYLTQLLKEHSLDENESKNKVKLETVHEESQVSGSSSGSGSIPTLIETSSSIKKKSTKKKK